ncbi:Protein of unknown function [Pyronema omphalodes CBS 100304]|uniref:Uncharacterized protein n=1 Tax=Pyronema omphalodes (strain CBS 100304) TaxID=1076935 RepID=U4LKN6_PYROM|nr:Protein of unknown function [Pyronema omphalodes CBS 100304]
MLHLTLLVTTSIMECMASPVFNKLCTP